MDGGGGEGVNRDGSAGKSGFVTYSFSRASTFWFKVLDSRHTGTDAWGGVGGVRGEGRGSAARGGEAAALDASPLPQQLPRFQATGGTQRARKGGKTHAIKNWKLP